MGTLLIFVVRFIDNIFIIIKAMLTGGGLLFRITNALDTINKIVVQRPLREIEFKHCWPHSTSSNKRPLDALSVC